MATTYKVKKGDTFSAIAAKAGIRLTELIALNPQIKNPNLINPGQVITTSKATAAKGATANAIVQQYTDAATGNEYLKGRYGPGSGLTAPGAIATTSRGATPPSGVKSGKDIQAEEAAKAYALSPAGMRAALDKLIAEDTAADAATATTTVIPKTEVPKQPGAAWIWDGTKWVKPPLPSKDKIYNWDDETGWKLKDVQPDLSKDVKPVGTPPAYVWDPNSKKWVQPPKPTDGKNYTWDNAEGWVESTIIAGFTGFTADNLDGPTLAINTFKNTLALFFGPAEINKPWVDILYKSVSGFYKTGSTAEESFNMALQDVRNNPIMEPFTKRFKGIFALQDLKVKGIAVEVPTIAEYFKSEAAMGDVLRSSGLGSLANEDFLGDVLGKNVSVTEFSNRIVSIFDRIDQAPKEIKDTISRFFPTVDRISLAKALALGDKGAKELQKEIAGYEILSAGEQQGLGVKPGELGGLDVARAANYAAMGETYQSALTNFGKVAKIMPGEEKLAAISGQKSIGQIGAEQAVFNKNAAQQKVLEDLAAQEEARFGGKAGNVGSKAFASQTRGMLY